MHPISDKELDKLFQEQFEEAEFQPSEKVWGNITERMNRQKSVKRSFPVLWMAAASVILVLAASLWFYRPIEVIRLQGGQMAENSTEDTGFNKATKSPVIESTQTVVNKLNLRGTKVKGVSNSEVIKETPVVERITQIGRIQVQGTESVALNSYTKRSNQEILQPKKEVKVPARYTGDQSNLDVTQADMIARVEVPETDIVTPQEASSLKKIRSIGSLVNFVISKVDHREDKIIEFKDGDEGSEVSGINLGLVKLKSRIK